VRPDFPEALSFLAVLLATSPDANIRDGPEAVRLAEPACELTHYQQAAMVSTLAAAYAEAGRFDEAIATAQRVCALVSASGDQTLLEQNRGMLQLCRAHKPYYEMSVARSVSPACRTFTHTGSRRLGEATSRVGSKDGTVTFYYKLYPVQSVRVEYDLQPPK
jgi:hypothetical protein